MHFPRPNPDRLVLFGMILTAGLYCRDLQYGFILDDRPLILLNDTFTSWQNWKLLFIPHASSTAELAMTYPGSFAIHYRPLYMLWLMTISKLSGTSTPWLHLGSLLLHIVIIFLVYRLGTKLIPGGWAAAFAALLFALHPVNVETTAYISASTDLLTTFFVLISVLSYLHFRTAPGSYWYLVLSLTAAALGMLCKETAAMVPCLILAWEIFAVDDNKIPPLWKRGLLALPYFAIDGLYYAWRTFLFGSTSWPAPSQHFLSAISSVLLVGVVYFRHLLWPFHLSFYYPTEWTSHWTLLRALGLLVVASAILWLWFRPFQRTIVRLQLAWIAIFFVPPLAAVFLFVRDDWVHDRHMYLASVPFCILLAILFSSIPAASERFKIAAGLSLSALFLSVTFLQVPYFSDELTLYERALQIAPENITLQRYYAWRLLNYGRTSDSLREFRQITVELPYVATACEEYAAALIEAGKPEEAALQLKKVIEYSRKRTPFRAFALYRLGNLEVSQNQLESAAAHLREAISIEPEMPNYHGALARVLRLQGFSEEADKAYAQELRIRQQGHTSLP